MSVWEGLGLVCWGGGRLARLLGREGLGSSAPEEDWAWSVSEEGLGSSALEKGLGLVGFGGRTGLVCSGGSGRMKR